MRLPLFLLVVGLVAGTQVQAQPQLSRLGTSPAARTPSANTAARMDPCVRSRTSVTAGATLRYDTDSLGAFRQNTLVSPATTDFGTVSLRSDTLVYMAFTATDAARDTIRIRSCTDEAGEDCSEREIVVTVGRAGTRRDTSIAVVGGEVREFGFEIPSTGIACASITPLGDYEYAEYREFRFATFFPSDRLRYRAARASGDDAFEVVVCTPFGTCDTTVVNFTIEGVRATLPFFDDFSYAGPRPDPTLWLEDDVFVNDAFGLAAPSYGVATFDGVDGGGRNYGLGYQDVDQLTTVPLDLSALAGRQIYLKYYLQTGGRGQAPEFEDNFFTQFRRADGTWATVGQTRGSRTSRADTVFTHVAIPVDSASFFHANFQVRFLMRANAAGLFDIWNLDYVRVEEALDNSASFRDIALAARPPSPLAPYTVVPYSQFVGRPSLLRDQLPVAVFNHFPEANNISSSAAVVEDAFGVELLQAGLLTGQQFNLPPGLNRFVNAIPAAPLEAYRQAASSLPPEAVRPLTLSYRLGIDQDQIRLPGVLRNDTASRSAYIDAEFAYDDGTAEVGIANSRTGDRIVVRYRSFVADTLRGLRFAFPNLNAADAGRQLINLQVYVGELGDRARRPDYEQILVKPFFPTDNTDTIQGFTTYRLEDAAGEPTSLVIPAGDFYVGWQQASDVARPLEVGVDLNADNGGEVFTEYGAGWVRVKDVIRSFGGSLMVRPIFSDTSPGNTSRTDEITTGELEVYPNPSRGQVRLVDDQEAFAGGSFTVLDVAGRPVLRGAFAKTLALDLAPGLYVLAVQSPDGRLRATERLVIQP